MAGRLAGKVALISGGARGQGAAEGKLFAREGAKVVLGDVLDAEGLQTAREIEAAGGSAVYIHLDVTQEVEWKNAVGVAVRNFGKLNILVNNAGILRMEGIEDTTLEIWNRVIAVNQTGVFLGMKHAIPVLRQAGGGSIINISSIAGLIGVGAAAAYQATKGAVRILTKSAAVQYAKENIRVNSIHPGVITTLMVTQGIDPEARKLFEQATPLGREGSAEEIATGVLFLASDESSYMTGAELVLDGGYTAQ
ncbi:MAG TPA: glucose 1-dehydrogenase [Candidatus Binatia bacterium]|jgi:NAD(P)-dependent dehydrogenase (short-subunit alcohol dehydrogenase family)|nr:glucose 1-dehydrogenase [Candidatus Binatia bacterium]